ncbi:MAG: tetratricopeptide repeat protein [Coriobacteriia bacterium]
MAPSRSSQTRLAEGLARQGQIDPAVDACFQGLRLDERDVLAHCLLAELMLAGDFYDEAIAEATLAIEFDPDCAPAYLALGLAYDRRGGMWDQAVLVWHELAEVVPDLVTAHVQLGEAFWAAAFEEEAVEAWRAALALDPKEPRATYNLAVAALEREGMATALPQFRKAGELDPSQDELFFALAGDGDGVALARGGDLFGALDSARAVLDERPDEASALALASYAYLKQEGTNEATALALRALECEPGVPGALYCLGVAYSRRPGLDRHAARVFRALTKAAPRHPMPHVLLAESLLGLQRFDVARSAYRTAVRLDPACVRARFGLAAVLLTEGRHAEASWEVRRAAYHDTRRQGLFWKLFDAYAEGVEDA